MEGEDDSTEGPEHDCDDEISVFRFSSVLICSTTSGHQKENLRENFESRPWAAFLY